MLLPRTLKNKYYRWFSLRPTVYYTHKKGTYITLANDQLDAQFFYFIISLLQYTTCFEQRRAHHQEVKLY